MASKEKPTSKYNKGITLLGPITLGLILWCCNPNKPKETTMAIGTSQESIPEKIDFIFHVKPILSDRCFACHGPDKNAVEGNLSLHTEAEAYKALGEQGDYFAIVPGKPDQSELVNRIYHEDPSMVMPPPESNLSLSEFEKEILKKWIAQGAEYKDHWAFTKPQKQTIPEPKGDWGNNAIDSFILAKLESKGLQPAQATTKEKLIRRVYFDLTGLPPSPGEIQAFIEDNTPEAFAKVVDTLLNSMDYAEHMAAEWMDIARYADTHGYQDDFERIMWPWRDWVIHAFAENTPYDIFVTQQLAGDLLPNATPATILATGFNRNHKITYEGGVIPEEYRTEYVADRAQTFSTAFLGLTVECARCHDHKYDPVSQQNFFELFAFFNNINEKGLINRASEIPEPYMVINKVEAQGVLDFVNLQKTDQDKVPVMVMKEMEQPRNTYILARGVYDQPTDEVFPNTPEAVLPYPTDAPKNRLGLANWLFNKENPLTARVLVNRLWQRMYGTGLVASSLDFGNQGTLPTHPELLDYLALKVQEEEWDVKKILKFMALSATYQQSTVTDAATLEVDPENQWLARASRLRLPAETIRDQALAISGLLNKEVGGPSVKPYQPQGLWQETTGGGGGSTSKYVPGKGGDLYRKSLYTFWKRTVPPPSMMTFDASSRDLCSVKRQQTNTPLQALVLLNDPQLIEAARVLATKALEELPDDLDAQISFVFQKATSRLPNEDELQILREQYQASLLKIGTGEINPEAYLTIGEQQLSDTPLQKELTAMALTTHTILNLDETITRG